jgi:hypothetical protein
VAGVSLADGGGRAAFLKAVARKLTNRLKHQEARFAVGVLALMQQALLDQRRGPVEDLDREKTVWVTNIFGGVQTTAADEDTQPGEQELLRLGEEVKTPRNRPAQRLLALVEIVASGGTE